MDRTVSIVLKILILVVAVVLLFTVSPADSDSEYLEEAEDAEVVAASEPVTPLQTPPEPVAAEPVAPLVTPLSEPQVPLVEAEETPVNQGPEIMVDGVGGDVVSEEPEAVVERLSLPDHFKDGLIAIEQINADLFLIEQEVGGLHKFVYILSKDQTLDVSEGSFTITVNNEVFYFINGDYYPLSKYQEFKLEEEAEKLRERNAPFIDAGTTDRLVYICAPSGNSFVYVPNAPDNVDQARLYYFDVDEGNVRFRQLTFEEEQYDRASCNP